MSGATSFDLLRLRLRQLRDDTRADVETVRSLRAVERRRGVIDELLTDLDGQLERTESAAVITLVGATGAGKSTLLNALVGQEIAEEGVDRPTTTVATIYAPVDAEISELAAAGGVAGSTARVVRYTPRERGAAAQVFVDAPDMNSIAGEHARRVAALAQHSDVLLVVLHRQSVVEAAPVEFLDRFAPRRALAFVLNRADELADDAREALVRQIETFGRERWGGGEAPVIAVSARRAKAQPEGVDRTLLWTTVHGLVDGQATARIRRHNAVGTAAMLADVFREARTEVGADLGALPDEVATGVARLTEVVGAASGERWKLSGVTLRHCLWSETARRWDGPGGWALRFGALDVAGAGAAGLLLRRNPVVAAGLALGTAAAAGVRRARAQLEVPDANPLLPPPEEIASAFRSGLAPARVRMGRIASADGSLQLPPVEEAAAAMTAAVDGSWRALVDYELPRAAERSVLRFLRWPIDLPVYALALWLVYRAGLGLISGEYAGVDLLLNVALVAAVYLGTVRWLVGLGLRARARRLLDAAALRSQLELQRWYENADADLRERVAAVRAALDRLAVLDEHWLRAASARSDASALAFASQSGKQARRR